LNAANLNVADLNIADLNIMGHGRLLPRAALLVLTASRFVYFQSKYCAEWLTFRVPIRLSWRYDVTNS